jgi:hypothetical protein
MFAAHSERFLILSKPNFALAQVPDRSTNTYTYYVKTRQYSLKSCTILRRHDLEEHPLRRPRGSAPTTQGVERGLASSKKFTVANQKAQRTARPQTPMRAALVCATWTR